MGTVEDYPLSTPEEIAARPPLIAKRRGSKPAVTPIGSENFAGANAETSAEKQTPEPAQPVGEAPGAALTAEQEKQNVAKEEAAKNAAEEPAKEAATTTESAEKKESTEEPSTEKKDDAKEDEKTDKPAGSGWSSGGPSPFASCGFQPGSNPFASGSSNPFDTTGTSTFSFGGSNSSTLSFSLPTSTPASLGESGRANKEPLVTEQKVTTGEEDEEKVYSDTVRLYQLCVPEAKEGEDGKKEEETKSDAPAEKKWIQRGRGELRLNCLKDGGGKARIIVRREKTHQLLINMPLFCNITCKRASDCDLRIVGFNQGPDSSDLVPESYLIRQRSATHSAELEKHLDKFVHPPGSIDPNSAATKSTTEEKPAEEAKPAESTTEEPKPAETTTETKEPTEEKAAVEATNATDAEA